jgi:hypothetical protein
MDSTPPGDVGICRRIDARQTMIAIPVARHPARSTIDDTRVPIRAGPDHPPVPPVTARGQ